MTSEARRPWNFSVHIFILIALSAPAWAAPPEKLPTEDPPQGPLHPLLAGTIKAGPSAPQWASLVTPIKTCRLSFVSNTR